MGVKRKLAIGRCAGIMFLGAALTGAPAALILPGPLPSALILVAAVVGAISGVICMLLPWDRFPEHALHALPPIAVAEVTFVVLVSGGDGEIFRWFWVLCAIFIAYAFRSRRAVITHLALMCASMTVTAFVALDADANAFARGVVGVPITCLAAGVVVWLRENLERRERTDSLTGLANRLALMEDLTALNVPRTLALFDLDGFKAYNDRYGHQAGDELLTRFGRGLRRAVQGHGRAYRLGGDELCVLVDDPDVLLACDAALREGEISASRGSALLPLEADTPSAALSVVDARMYAAKRAGRGTPFVVELNPSTPAASVPGPARASSGVRPARLPPVPRHR